MNMDDASHRSNVPVRHTDAFTQDLRSNTTDGDGEYETWLAYKKAQQKQEYGAVEERGTEITLSHPVTDIHELTHTAHLAVQLAQANRDRIAITPDSARLDGIEFDTALLRVADRALAAEGISIVELPINPRYVNALFIKEARHLPSNEQLVNHLAASNRTARAIGFTTTDAIPNQSTFWRAATTLKEEGLHSALTDASTRAVYAVYRNGIDVPEAVKPYYQFGRLSPTLDEREISASMRRAAIRNWIDRFFETAVDSLTFNRAGNESYPLSAYVGLYAHSALQSVGLKNATASAGWLYDDAVIPDGSTALKHITNLSLDDIKAQFTAANYSLLQLCHDRGFFDDEPDLAFDTVGFPWQGGDTEWTVNRPAEKHSDVEQEWVFAVLSIMETDARFTLGVRPVKDKSTTTQALRELLGIATDHIDIGRVHADREFYDGDAVHALRAHVGNNWVIHAKKIGDVKELVETTRKGTIGFRENVGTFAYPRPNAFAYPKEDQTGQATLATFTERRSDDAAGVGSPYTHKPYLTDLTPDDTSGHGLHFRYNDRWNIETFMRQFKHDFHPLTRSDDPRHRLYFANIAVLCHNIHTLINRAPAPDYGHRLSATHHEVLTALRDVAFTRADTAQHD